MIGFISRAVLTFLLLAAVVVLLTRAGLTPGPWTPWVLATASLAIAGMSAPEKKK